MLAKANPRILGPYIIRSFATNRPYNDHDKALHHVVKLVKKGIEAVDFSRITVDKEPRGEPISTTAIPQPNKPSVFAESEMKRVPANSNIANAHKEIGKSDDDE